MVQITTTSVPHKYRNKYLRDSGGNVTMGQGGSGSSGGNSDYASEAYHAEKADLAKKANKAVEAEHAAKADLATKAVEADHSASTAALDDDLREELEAEFLRKDKDDETTHTLTVASEVVKGAIHSDNFVTGAPLTGSGWNISRNGEIQADTLKLRTALEVPELRFNRASIIAGTNIQSPCAGIIKSVTPTSATTGIATLDLGDDDIAGSIAVGDLCWGYYHDISTKSNNATADSDDHSGNINYRGFATVYFQISEILNKNSTQFKYELRPETNADGSPKFPLHPYPQMHFGGRGSTKDKSRQGFTIATPHYTATYQLVSSWDWDDQVKYIVRVSGRLDGFEALAGREAGSWNNHNGTIDTNLYVRGNINKVTLDRRFLYITQSSNGILEPDETETVTILIRDSAFNNLTAAYTITVNGQTYTKKDEVTIQFAYSDLTQEITRIPVTATYGEETLTATITLRKLAPIETEMLIDYGGDTMIALGEVKSLSFRLRTNTGYDVTDTAYAWKIERESSDEESDVVWNARDKAKNFAAQKYVSHADIELTWDSDATVNDIDNDAPSTTFRITAYTGKEEVVTILEI